MVPERTVARLELLLEADAQILVCSARSIACGDDHWKHKFDEVRRRWSDDPTARRYRMDVADYFARSRWRPAGDIVVSEQYSVTIDHLVVKSDRGWPIFDVHNGPAQIIIGSHDIQVPPGTPLVRSRSGGTVPGGVYFKGDPPKL